MSLPPLSCNDNELVVQFKYPNTSSIEEQSTDSFLLPPYVEKFEGFGEVVKVGLEIQNYKESDSVIIIEYGHSPWNEYATVTSDQIMKLPKFFDPVEASTRYTNMCNAYRLLSDYGKHEVLIQNAADSKIGKAIIQFAKFKNITTICIINSGVEEEKSRSELINLGATHVFTEVEFRTTEILNLIRHMKATLALNAVGGDITTKICSCLSFGGKLVTYAAYTMEPIIVSPFLLIAMNISLHGFWLPQWVNRHKYLDKVEMLLYINQLDLHG